MLRIGLIFMLVAFVVFAAAPYLLPTLLRPTAQVQQRSDDKIQVKEIKIKSRIYLACIGPRELIPSVVVDNGKARVRAEANTEVPLNFRWTVTAGRILGSGADVIWDLSGNAPGEYSITVTTEDGVGGRGEPFTRTVSLVDPPCIYPCACPAISVHTRTSEVRPGDVVIFEAHVFGGEFEDGPKFFWRVENGRMRSGQATDSIEVVATGEVGSNVTATVEIGGFDRNCQCSHVASESVKIGEQTVVHDIPATVGWVNLDERSVEVGCPFKSMTRPSKDMIVAVTTSARSNSIRDRLKYAYAVTGGAIRGSGPKVDWDLTGLQPGVYELAVSVDDGRGPSEPKKASITVADTDCIRDPECPTLSLATPRRIGTSDDYVVMGSAVGGTFADFRYSWNVVGGTIIAGQGTSSVRVRSRWNRSDPTPHVELSLRVLMEDKIFPYCEANASAFLTKGTLPELE